MRFPGTRLYRAFPELDRFSDAQCEAWVRRAWRARRVAMWTGIGIAGVLGLALAAGIMRLTEGIARHWIDTVGSTLSLASSIGLLAVVMAWVVVSVGPPMVLALVVRDVVMRRCVRSQLRSARCVRCDYLLLGLPVRDDEVTCSECGERMALAALGLTPADLMARPEDRPEVRESGFRRNFEP